MRVDFEELELANDQSYWYDSQPFDGTALYRRDDGTIESEVTFEAGIQSGPFSDFHPDGHIACEGTFQFGVYHGQLRYWNNYGNLTKAEEYEFGICISRQEYDQTGTVVSEYKIDPNDPNAAILAARRNQIES